MQETTLMAQGRSEAGSASSRRLRTQGRIPAVVYGHGSDPVTVSVDRVEFRNLVRVAGANALISLDIDGSKELSIIKEMQHHPLKDRVDHIDFQLIRRDEGIVVEVPIVLIGEPEELIRQGGLVQQHMTTLTVSAPASEIPRSLEADISELEEGDAVRVGDVTLPSNVTTEVDFEAVIATGVVSRAAVAALDEDELAEGEEELEDGEEGEDGDATGEDGDS